jgi:hypothetical protein
MAWQVSAAIETSPGIEDYIYGCAMIFKERYL